MALFKEIVTKAVIGKGKKLFKDNYNIDVENIFNNRVLYLLNLLLFFFNEILKLM